MWVAAVQAALKTWLAKAGPGSDLYEAAKRIGTLPLAALGAHALEYACARPAYPRRLYLQLVARWTVREFQFRAGKRELSGRERERAYQLGESVGEVTLEATAGAEFRLEWGEVVLYPGKAFVERSLAALRALDPPRFQYLPMRCPALEWPGQRGGGYLTERLRRRPLVDAGSAAQGEALESAIAAEVLDGVNALQRRARFRVDRAILEVAVRGVCDKLAYPGLPSWEDEPMPRRGPKSAPGFFRWKARKMATACRRVAVVRTLSAARRVEGARELSFPVHLDARGRLYPLSSALSYQGGDLELALLSPATEAKSARSEAHAREGFRLYTGERDLSGGCGKWAADLEPELRRMVGNPGESRGFWGAAKRPWQFLAWARSWLGDGPPVLQLDATSSAFQMIALLLRDRDLAARTSLLERAARPDLYEALAAETWKRLESETNANAAAVRAFLGGSVSRSLAKAVLLPRPYGLTIHGAREAVRDWAFAHPGKLRPEHRDNALHMLTYNLWMATKTVLPGLDDLLAWSRALAAAASRSQTTLSWTLPDGFPVSIEPKRLRRRSVETVSGPVVAIQAAAASRATRSRFVAGALAFVLQSMDAFAARAIHRTLDREGIPFFASRHDGFRILEESRAALISAARGAYARLLEAPLFDMLCHNLQPVVRVGDALPVRPPALGILTAGELGPHLLA